VEPENASNGIVIATGSLFTLELDELNEPLLIDELEPGALPESELELELPQNTANYKFCGVEILPSFSCYDVMKNPQIDADITRLREHLSAIF